MQNNFIKKLQLVKDAIHQKVGAVEIFALMVLQDRSEYKNYRFDDLKWDLVVAGSQLEDKRHKIIDVVFDDKADQEIILSIKSVQLISMDSNFASKIIEIMNDADFKQAIQNGGKAVYYKNLFYTADDKIVSDAVIFGANTKDLTPRPNTDLNDYIWDVNKEKRQVESFTY